MFANTVLALVIFRPVHNIDAASLPSTPQLDIIFTLKHILSAYKSCVHIIFDLKSPMNSPTYSRSFSNMGDNEPICSSRYIEDRVSPIPLIYICTNIAQLQLLTSHLFVTIFVHFKSLEQS